MLSKTHFYNETLKKTVAIFGTLFNNITIAKKIITVPATSSTSTIGPKYISANQPPRGTRGTLTFIDTTGIFIGSKVSGAGIASGTIVTTIIVNHSITLNQVTTSIITTATALTFTTTTAIPASSTISDIERVPIAYGPKAKFLARIKEQPDLTAVKIAIKVPRMSFEITSIAYDASIKLNRLNKHFKPITPTVSSLPVTSYSGQFQSTPYKIGIELSIFGHSQDDVLQILEQILPTFNPEYTVTVLDMEAPGVHADVPIILDSVGISDEYEGDLSTTRRVIIYTLSFTVRIRFTGPTVAQKVIKCVEANMIVDSNLGYADYSVNGSLDPLEIITAFPPTSTNPTGTVIADIDTPGFGTTFCP